MPPEYQLTHTPHHANAKNMNYNLQIANCSLRFYQLGLATTSKIITKDVTRLHIPYADTQLTVDIIHDRDNCEKGHELSLVALGMCSRNTLTVIMKSVMHDLTQSSLFEGILALCNAARQHLHLVAENVLNGKVGGGAFCSRLPGIEYLNAEDKSWVHCKVPLYQVSSDNGPPSTAQGARLAVSFRCCFDRDHMTQTPDIHLSTEHGNIPLQLPLWNNTQSTINSYVEQLAQLVRDQWVLRNTFFSCLNQHFHFPVDCALVSRTFSSFLVEYAPTKKKTRLCLVTIHTVKPYPEHAPHVILRQIWPEQGLSDFNLTLLHSPRWSPEESAQRLYAQVIQTVAKGFVH